MFFLYRSCYCQILGQLWKKLAILWPAENFLKIFLWSTKVIFLYFMVCKHKKLCETSHLKTVFPFCQKCLQLQTPFENCFLSWTFCLELQIPFKNCFLIPEPWPSWWCWQNRRQTWPWSSRRNEPWFSTWKRRKIIKTLKWVLYIYFQIII